MLRRLVMKESFIHQIDTSIETNPKYERGAGRKQAEQTES